MYSKTIFTKGRSPVIEINTTLVKANETINRVEIQTRALESEKTKKTPAQIENIEFLIEGYQKLIEYINKLNDLRNAFGIKPGDSIAVLFGKFDKLSDLQKEISKIEQEEKEKTKECADIQKKINSATSVDLSFISAALPTNSDVETALADPTKDADFKRLQSGNISALIADYIFIKRTLFDITGIFKSFCNKIL